MGGTRRDLVEAHLSHEVQINCEWVICSMKFDVPAAHAQGLNYILSTR